MVDRTVAGGRWRARLLLLLVALAWAFLFLGTRPLSDPDEGRYAEAAREMLVHGSWLVPLLGGRPHLTKPPPTYWLAAGGIALLGRNEWGARFGTGLAFAFSILAAGALGRVLADGDRRAGRFAALAWATGLLPFVGGSLVTTDPVLAAVEAGAVLAGARALLVPGPARRRALRLAWIALGLAFFVKGPAGLLPLAGLAWAWPRRRDPREDDRFLDPVGLVLFAGIAAWWYLAVSLRDPGRLREFVVVELFERVCTRRLRRSGPPWLPAGVLLAGSLPWGAFLVPLARRIRARGLLADPRVRLLGGWLGASLLVFTVSRSRMPLYVLPVSLAILVPSGIALAGTWSRAGRRGRGAIVLLALAWAGTLAGLRATAGETPRYRTARPAARAVVRARLPGEPVVVPGSRPWPGLSFYLGEEGYLLDPAANRGGDRFRLDATSFRARLAREWRSVLLVARGNELAALPLDGLVLETVAEGDGHPPWRVVRVRAAAVSP